MTNTGTLDKYNPKNDKKSNFENIEITMFSHDNLSEEFERLMLERKYLPIVEETDEFNRKLVSYQANKKKEVHSWIKYKEGFSSELVKSFILEFGLGKNDYVLDPFLGSGTTLLTAYVEGVNSVGIDILPLCYEIAEVKSKIFEYDLEELNNAYSELCGLKPDMVEGQINYIKITESAYPKETESELAYYEGWIKKSDYSENTKKLLKLVITSILEDVSYTRKDGQYLRWDYRSEKVKQANKKRNEAGKPQLKTLFNKGDIPSVRDSFLAGFKSAIQDIENMQSTKHNSAEIKILKESVLYALPKLESDKFSAVITSPPYCNRYDYTRTYALELAYMGVNEKKIRELRQSQLSCTVENKCKLQQLEEYYRSLNRISDYEKIVQIIENNSVLNEINHALQNRLENGEINNKGILSMVNEYFTELTFVFYELYRTCKPHAKVVFVNDNVRYAGEVIPVDFLSTDIAEKIGFKPVKIYVLKQKKGNSSQQMDKYGRLPMRKSITVWEKN